MEIVLVIWFGISTPFSLPIPPQPRRLLSHGPMGRCRWKEKQRCFYILVSVCVLQITQRAASSSALYADVFTHVWCPITICMHTLCISPIAIQLSITSLQSSLANPVIWVLAGVKDVTKVYSDTLCGLPLLPYSMWKLRSAKKNLLCRSRSWDLVRERH